MKSIKLIILVCIISVMFFTPTYAGDTELAIIADEGYDQLVEPVDQLVHTHIPQSLIEVFNKYEGTIELTQNDLGLAGRTYCKGFGSNIFTLEKPTTMEIAPIYDWNTIEETTLHEFGHVLDMYTGITGDAIMGRKIDEEVKNYEMLVHLLNDKIMECHTKNEVFAQVFAATVGSDGTVDYAALITQSCPYTTKCVQKAMSIITRDNYLRVNKIKSK